MNVVHDQDECRFLILSLFFVIPQRVTRWVSDYLVNIRYTKGVYQNNIKIYTAFPCAGSLLKFDQT